MRIWPIIKSFPIAVGLPLVIGAASVGPDDAASNLSKWVNQLGFETLPSWLTEKAADHQVTTLAFLMSIIYAIFVWAPPWRWQKIRTKTDLQGGNIELPFRPGVSVASISAPQLIIGVDGHYEHKRACGLYKTTHTFSIGIKNKNQHVFLSNCKLYLDIDGRDGHVPKNYLLLDAFTLNAAEERYLSIVSYDEPATVSGYTGADIRLHIPVHAGYLDVGYGWPWQMPVGAYTFTLRVISRETGPNEVVCKTWVDDAGKLHFQKA